MKHVMFFVILSIVLIVNFVYSKETDDDYVEGLFQGQFEDQLLDVIRRGSPQCEPCGALRRPCCFPNLCQHRKPRPSKCLKVQG